MSRVMFAVWAATAALMLFLITQPVGVTSQTALSLAIIVALALIWLLRLRGIWRHVFLALGSVVVLRYAYWRTTATLPPVSDLASFVPGLILYIAEMYCIVMLAISLFVISDPRKRPGAPPVAPEAAPTVDVLVPSYNEPADILALTLSAAKAMDYPAGRVTVYLLDDGATSEKLDSRDPEVARIARRRAAELKALCGKLGVTYHARHWNENAKAGNLNSGLEISRGELVVVFDADHAPDRNFLKETVGYFAEDPRLFLVQTPHFFSNPDPIERNLGTFEHMPSENEMFYGRIQPGLDRWNAAFFCGSAAVLRREALDEVGGFSGITITEDCETSLDLHAQGWNSVYVDKPLISGLQPSTFTSFIGQRSRWCRGMVQILMLKNPLFRRGLSLGQRVGYLSSSLFWLFPFARATFFVAPLLFILFNLKIYVSSVEEFLAYTVTYLIVSEMIRSYLYGSVRWPWVSELYEYVQSVYLVRAIVSVIVSPRRPTFNVTAKGDHVRMDRLSELSLPYFVIFAVFCVTLFVCAYRYQTEPEIAGLLVVVGIWQFVNLVLAGAALGVVTEKAERRVANRLPGHAEVDLQIGEDHFRASLKDVSTADAAVRFIGAAPHDVRRGQRAVLRAIDAPAELEGTQLSVRLVYSPTKGQGADLAVVFDPAQQDYPLLAHLMYSDMAAAREQRDRRRRSRGILRASWNLLSWALKSPLNFVWLALSQRGRAEEPKPQVAPVRIAAPRDAVKQLEMASVPREARPARSHHSRKPRSRRSQNRLKTSVDAL